MAIKQIKNKNKGRNSEKQNIRKKERKNKKAITNKTMKKRRIGNV